ncbi:MAG TPA: hypothetical protein VGO43_03360 [Pyrinomonadaceae bacterium]|jgi:hypothetical protein|nr:hypothetical protein [Pyrinomonadaceae bacterium]
MNSSIRLRDSERGSAGVNFTIILAVIVLLANAGYNYVPVAYDAESLKTEMETAVLQGLALPGKVSPVDNVKVRIQKAAVVNNIPSDVVIDVRQNANAITAHVTYSKQVNILPFGLYKYNYVFDHTATPTGFLLKQ